MCNVFERYDLYLLKVKDKLLIYSSVFIGVFIS